MRITDDPYVIQRGRELAAERAREDEQRRLAWRAENMRHTLSWFRRDFYREHYVYEKGTYASGGGRYVEDPEDPFPEITGWRLLNEALRDSTHAASVFVCEGMEFVCRWEFHPGGDRAYWDDGWWPQWSLVVMRPRRFLRFLKERVEVRVYGPQNVAEAMS